MQSQERKAYKWWVVGMLWCVCFFNYADRQAIFSVFPVLKSDFRLSDVQLGVIGASFMWVYALVGPIAGWIGDRVSRKGLILGGLVFWSLITAATALSTTYLHLVFWRALSGLGEAFYFPASMSLIADYHGSDTRSRAMSFHQSSVYAGTIAGGAVIGFLAQYNGWRFSFTLFGLLGLVVAIALLVFLREPERNSFVGLQEHEHSGSVKGLEVRSLLQQILGNRVVVLLIVVFIGANFVAMIFLTWMPSFLYRKFSMSLSLAGLNATVYLQLASILGVISGGVLADRLVRWYAGGRMITQTVGLVAGAPFLFLAGWTASAPVIAIALAGFGYCKGLYDSNVFASLYDVVRVERRAAAVGFLNSLGWLGASAAPVALAVGSDHLGMSLCISATSVIYLFIGCVLGWQAKQFKLSTNPEVDGQPHVEALAR